MTESDHILGGYQTDFAKAWSRHGQDLSDMVREATLGALAASRVDAAQVQSIHVGNAFGEDRIIDFPLSEGTRLMNEAQNLLTPEARLSAMRIRLIDKLEGIIRESVKPMERIEGIRIMHVEGLGGGSGGGGGQGNGGNVADSVVNSALRFRAQAPLIDQLLREIGVQGGDVGQAAKALLERGENG